MFRSTMFFILLFSLKIFSQDPNILNKLNSTDASSILFAIEEIKKNNLTEFTETLELIALNQQSNNMTILVFETLSQLKSSRLGELVKKHIARIDNWENTYDFENMIARKAELARILLRIGDYSKVDYIFSYLDAETKGLAHKKHLKDLLLIYRSSPEYKEKYIQNVLVAIELDNYYTTYKALSILKQMDYDKIEEVYVEVARKADNVNVRIEAIRILKGEVTKPLITCCLKDCRKIKLSV